MQFDALCNLILEAEVLSKEFLKNYYAFMLKKGSKNARVVQDYLRKTRTPESTALVVKHSDPDCYYLLIGKYCPYKKYLRVLNGVTKLNVYADTWDAENQYNTVAGTLPGSLRKIQSVEDYSVDWDVKDAWKGVIDEL